MPDRLSRGPYARSTGGPARGAPAATSPEGRRRSRAGIRRASRGGRLASALALLLLATGPAAATAADPLRAQQWHLDAIRAPAGAAADGVLVAVLDTGVDGAHPDLAGVVTRAIDLNAGAAGEDLNGHGTNVAGIIAAVAGNGIGGEGVAPGARLLSVRVLDALQQGDTAVIARGIDAAVAAGAAVVNLSLTPGLEFGRTLDVTDPLVGAMQRAVAAGTVVVAAAGNFGLPWCAQPLAVTGILCVGAVGRALGLTAYTDFGFRVDVVAPGGDDVDGILSTASGGGYGAMAGTSQATPQVAALAALLVAQGLPAPHVADRIRQTARDLGTPGPDLRFGHGLIDVAAALGVTPPTGPASAPPAPVAATATPAGAAAISVRVPRSLTAAVVLRDGIRVTCRAPSAGWCTVRASRGGATFAGGRHRLAPGRTTAVRARPTAGGRRTLRVATKSFRVRISVRGPHAAAVGATVTIRPARAASLRREGVGEPAAGTAVGAHAARRAHRVDELQPAAAVAAGRGR